MVVDREGFVRGFIGYLVFSIQYLEGRLDGEFLNNLKLTSSSKKIFVILRSYWIAGFVFFAVVQFL